MIEQRWTTTDGRTWSITIGDKTAQVWLWLDNTTYGTCIWQINNAPTTLTCLDTYDDIKEAKQACLDEIERVNAQEKADKPKPPVILRGKMYGAAHLEYHDTVKEAADNAYWAIEQNTFMPCEIEHEGEIVWKSFIVTGEIYPSLASLAGIEDSEL